MIQLFYILGIYLYTFVVRLVAPFNTKAKFWITGRKNVFEKLEQALAANTSPVIWMHVASLGEFEQGRPLIEDAKRAYPDYKIVVSFFSPSGYEIRKDYPLADVVIYLPIDTPRNAKRFFDIVKPSAVFFVKYDFWYYYLRESKRRAIPTYLISSLFREGQLFFKPYGGFYRKILGFFTTIFVQDEASKALLSQISIDSVVAGDTRVDRVADLAEQAPEQALVAKFKGNEKLLVAGSTWQPDEAILVEFLQKNQAKLSLKVVLAPHEVHATHIQQLKEQFTKSEIRYQCYSEIEETAESFDFDVLIIDCIGLLSSLYQYADVAYIGGGFGAGIHNTLEPATFGVPIVFGRKYKRFTEAVAMVDGGGAFSIENSASCEAILSKLLTNDSFREEAGLVAKQFVAEQRGAVKLIFKHCFPILN